MDADDLMRGISRVPALAPEIAKRREDLLVAEGFWALPGIDIEKIVASSADRSERVVSSLMSSGVSVSRSAALHFQARQIICGLEKSGSGLDREGVEPWLQRCEVTRKI
jgi:hypothetical protein